MTKFRQSGYTIGDRVSIKITGITISLYQYARGHKEIEGRIIEFRDNNNNCVIDTKEFGNKIVRISDFYTEDPNKYFRNGKWYNFANTYTKDQLFVSELQNYANYDYAQLRFKYGIKNGNLLNSPIEIYCKELIDFKEIHFENIVRYLPIPLIEELRNKDHYSNDNYDHDLRIDISRNLNPFFDDKQIQRYKKEEEEKKFDDIIKSVVNFDADDFTKITIAKEIKIIPLNDD